MKYSAWSKDVDNLLKSSSGGIFYELAKKMVESGGKVVGVVMDGVKAKYVLSNDLDEIKKMRGSKYIPSNPSSVINEVKNCVNPILFVGLPCHINAVKKRCNTENMILCDLVCHGLPKSGIFEKHIKKISNGRNLLEVKFRDKKTGWEGDARCQSLILKFSNGDIYDKFDDYMKNYTDNTILLNTCKTCKNNNVGDITIGDFWGVPPALKNKLGTSIVSINTLKGKKILNSINSITKKNVKFYHYFNIVSLKYIAFKSIYKSGLLPVIKNIGGLK